MLAQPSALAPVIALALWTHVIMAWMLATRLPAIKAARLRLDPKAPRGAQMASLPAQVRWKADHYNHLLEHPTVFYAVVIVVALVDREGSLNLALAWIYVGLRVGHSLVQALVNKIELRFMLFALSALTLLIMILNTARLVF